ncbi:Hypothetical predicted protein, partial [Prunus dulcis]
HRLQGDFCSRGQIDHRPLLVIHCCSSRLAFYIKWMYKMHFYMGICLRRFTCYHLL